MKPRIAQHLITSGAVVAAALLATAAVATEVTAGSAETGLTESVQSLLADFQSGYGFPGATVSFVLPDGLTGDVAVGLADVEAGTAMTPQSRMLAASIGKSIVGALVLSLESDGLLDREARVADLIGDTDWFPRLPNAELITVGHLLNHTAGLPDHVHMDGVVRDLMEHAAEGEVRPQDAIAHVLDMPPLFEPGEGWSYSDTGYLLLGLAIEAATDRDVYDLVGERFLRPLQLTQTEPSNSPALEGLAVGYTVEDNPFGLPRRTTDSHGALLWNPAIEWTGGGFVSTSHDLARWGHALFSGSAWPAPYLDRLLDGVPVHADAPNVLYGSGVAIYAETEMGTVYGHGGWIPGYVSSLRHYADHGITIAFQINSDVGIVDDSTDLVSALETALAELLVAVIATD